MRKAGIKSKGIDGSADHKQLETERETYDREGEKVAGFASSVVPTLEEKTILEQRPPPNQTDDEKPGMDQNLHKGNGESQPQQGINDAKPQQTGGNSQAQQNKGKDKVPHDHDSDSNKAQQDGGDDKPNQNEEPEQARVNDGSHELYGAPADASKNPQTDDEPPHARSGKNDASEEERAAVDARGLIRKQLSAKIGNKHWTLLTPTPEVDPHGFDDPISDEFWKNVWVACAVHNVRVHSFDEQVRSLSCACRRKFSGKCSMPYQMI